MSSSAVVFSHTSVHNKQNMYFQVFTLGDANQQQEYNIHSLKR